MKKISATHIFYPEDRSSLFLSETIIKCAAPLLKENGFIKGESEIPDWVKNDIVNVLNDCGVTASEILSQARDAVFHSCEWLAAEAVKFTNGCESAVVFANDRIYAKATNCPDLIFIHPSDDPTMPDDVPYIVDYLILSSVYGVDP